MEHIIQEMKVSRDESYRSTFWTPRNDTILLCIACGEWVDFEEQEDFENSPCPCEEEG